MNQPHRDLYSSYNLAMIAPLAANSGQSGPERGRVQRLPLISVGRLPIASAAALSLWTVYDGQWFMPRRLNNNDGRSSCFAEDYANDAEFIYILGVFNPGFRLE